jgi:hypothetical protein
MYEMIVELKRVKVDDRHTDRHSEIANWWREDLGIILSVGILVPSATLNSRYL